MRSEFSPETKDLLAKRVGYRCSNPGCRQPTSGPREDPQKTTNIGVAAHITAAAPGPGAARYDKSLTDEKRRSIENGIWLCQNHGKLVDNDEVRYTVELLRDWKRQAEEAARQELESPTVAVPHEHEQLRARVAITAARLKRPLKLGEMPEIELHLVNTGNSTANHITRAHTGMVCAAEHLPKWELAEFGEIQAAHGDGPPKRDTFYSTSLEPRLGKNLNLVFMKVGWLLHAMGPSTFEQLGKPPKAAAAGPFAHIPVYPQRLFLFGYFEYETLGRLYRRKFCYTPKDYAGTKLVEGPQWNGEDDIGKDDRAGREERRVVAEIVAIGIELTSDVPLESSALRVRFFNIGPTPASNVMFDCWIGPSRNPEMRPTSGPFETLRPAFGFDSPWSPPLSEICGEAMEGVKTGAVPLVVEAVLSYSDVWEVGHERRFIGRYSAVSGRFELSQVLFSFVRPSDGATIDCEFIGPSRGSAGCGIRFYLGTDIVSSRAGFKHLPHASEWAKKERDRLERL